MVTELIYMCSMHGYVQAVDCFWNLCSWMSNIWSRDLDYEYQGCNLLDVQECRVGFDIQCLMNVC